MVNNDGAWTSWASERDRIKNLWVLAVVAFWLTVAIQVVMHFFQGRLSFILVSIAGSALVIGVWLKIRYQWHLRREPGRRRE